MKVILNGFFIGLTIAFSFGPGVWVLFNTSINKGFKSGLFFLSGFFLSDLTFLLIAFSINTFSKNFINSFWVGIIASVVMILFGLFTFNKKDEVQSFDNKKDIPVHLKNIGYILKGYLFNTSNPFNFIFWIGIVTISSGTYGINTIKSYLFIGSIFITAIFFDILKCYFASRLQKIIKDNILILINRIMGVVLICCGVVIFWKICC